MNANLTVRKFESSDADSVIALWNKALPSSQPWNEPTTVICRKLNLNDGLFFVGKQDGQVVATVLAGYDGVRGWIYALAVSADQRRRGVGRRMLEEAEKVLLSRGCAKINLQVQATNSEVIEFYEGCGFSVEDRASLGKPLMIDPKSAADPVPTIPVNEQITLSQITWDDKPSYLKHLNETDEFHALMGMMPFPYREFDADQWLSKVVRETLETDRRRNWAIRNNHGELIGGTGVFDITKCEKAEMGYWLAKPYWGQGIMTEVVRRLCKFAFDEYELRRIYAQAFATNPASARVLEKAGFALEGTLRSHHFRDGKPDDVLFFGMMRPA
jgi:RimJ/RimL family protein N-acetyltransferase